MQISKNHASPATADPGQPMTDGEFTQINRELTDPATGRLDPVRIAQLDPVTKHRYVTNLISLKRPIIANFVTTRQEEQVQKAGYESGYHNEFYGYWILPGHRPHFQTNTNALVAPATTETIADLPDPTPRLPPPDTTFRRLTQEISLEVAAEMEPKLTPVDEWPIPQPVTDSLLSVLSVTPSMIPDAFRAWLLDISFRMKCPLDFLASAAVVMLSSLIGTRLSIKPKQKDDDWTITPNLWGLLLATRRP